MILLKKEILFIAGIVAGSVLTLPGLLDLSHAPRFTALALFLLILLILIRRERPKGGVNLDYFVALYFLYVFYSTISVFWANTVSEAIFDAAKLWLGFFVFLLSKKFLKEQGENWLAKLGKLSVVIFYVAFAVGVFQLATLPNLSKENIYMVSGFNAHKNLFSSFLVLNLIFLIAGALLSGRRWKLFSICAILLSLCFLAILRTKAAWVGLCGGLVACVMYLVVYKVNKPLKNGALVITVLLIAFLNIFFVYVLPISVSKALPVNDAVTETNSGAASTLDQERLTVWKKTYSITEKRKWFGCGLGNWQVFFPDATLSGLWRVEDLNVTFQRPHNDFLWILSETGLIGLNLYFLLIIPFVLPFKLQRQSDSKAKHLIPAVFGSGLIAYLVASFFDFPKERAEHVIWLNLVLSVLHFYISREGNQITTRDIKLFFNPYSAGIIIVSFILLTGLLRIKGEYFTRKIYDFRAQNNAAEIIRAGKYARSYAYTMDPTSVPVLWYTGNAQVQLKNYEMALGDFQKAYFEHPYNRNVINDFASAYIFKNNASRAKELYEEAARISPRFDEPKLNLAALYINEENYESAQFWLDALMHDSERRNNYQRLVKLKLEEQGQKNKKPQ